MKLFSTIILISMVVFCSCNFWQKDVHGNGKIQKEPRSVNSFTGVEVRGAIDLVITQDPTRKVEIEADENLLQYIEVKTSGDDLIISTKDGYDLDATRSITAYVSAPEVTSVEASGACKVKGTNQLSSGSRLEISLSGASHANLDTKNPEVRAELSGASKLTLRGAAKDISFDASGSSHIEAFDLLSENATVDVSGASSANIFASVKVDADASGASRVRYRGGATSVQSDASGASSVVKAD